VKLLTRDDFVVQFNGFFKLLPLTLFADGALLVTAVVDDGILRRGTCFAVRLDPSNQIIAKEMLANEAIAKETSRLENIVKLTIHLSNSLLNPKNPPPHLNMRS